MIHYDGVGADPSGVHTDEQFVEIMKRDVENKKWQRRPETNPFNWIYENEIQLKFNDWVLPDDFCYFTLDDWIDYAGAVRAPRLYVGN
jgi:hypothetical protein